MEAATPLPLWLNAFVLPVFVTGNIIRALLVPMRLGQNQISLSNCCFPFLAKHSLVPGAFQLPKSPLHALTVGAKTFAFSLSESPYCDHEGGKWLFLSWWLAKGPVHSSFSFLWFLLYSLLSACFRSELMDSRRDPPKQTDAILKHSSPPNPSVYP